jgi:hypothetical protein
MDNVHNQYLHSEMELILLLSFNFPYNMDKSPTTYSRCFLEVLIVEDNELLL